MGGVPITTLESTDSLTKSLLTGASSGLDTGPLSLSALTGVSSGSQLTGSQPKTFEPDTHSSGRLADFLQSSTPPASIPIWVTDSDTDLLRTGIVSGAELAGSLPTSTLTGITSGFELTGSQPTSTLTSLTAGSEPIGALSISTPTGLSSESELTRVRPISALTDISSGVGLIGSQPSTSEVGAYSSGKLTDFLQPSAPPSPIMVGVTNSQPTSLLTGASSGSELIGSRPISTLNSISTESVLIGSPGQK
jgi:hypothetical protein